MHAVNSKITPKQCGGVRRAHTPVDGGGSYQADHDGTQLDDVRVGHGVQTANQRVKDGDTRRQDHGLRDRDAQDHSQGGAWNGIV